MPVLGKLNNRGDDDTLQAMEKVTGIGGVFFRARDPKALQHWYQQHLGVTVTPANYEQLPWQQEAGPTAFEPFPHDTLYFGPPGKVWMINFRVRNLVAMVTQLRAAGVEVTVDPETYPNGRFARLHDPEGNPVELWEPQGRDAPVGLGTGRRARSPTVKGHIRNRVSTA